MAVSTAQPKTTEALLEDLRILVSRNNRRARWVVLWQALAFAVTLITAVFLGVLVTDYYFHLTSAGRVVALLVVIGCLVGVVWHVARRWSRTRYTEDQIALSIEQRTSALDNRLINALQLARDKRVPDSRLSEALIRENHQRLHSLQLRSAVSLRPVLIGGGAVLGIFLVGAILLLVQGSSFKNSLVRILLPLAELNPIYRTVLEVEPGSVKVERGSDVRLTIRIQGEKPDRVVVAYFSGGKRQTELLMVAPEATQVSYLFKQVQDDITYSVQGGDFRSEIYTITVPMPASLKALQAEIQPPDYTKLPMVKTESASGSLEALLGSRAKLLFQFNRPVEQAVLLLEKVGEDGGVSLERVPLTASSPTEAAGELLFEKVNGYRLELTQNGKVIESALYTIRVLDDQPPQLRIEGLEREEEAEVDFSYPLTLIAEDDYGVSQAALAIRKADSAEEWRKIQEFPPEGKAYWKASAILDLQTLDIAEGDRIEVALLARDTNPQKAEGPWVESSPSLIVIGGKGARLEILYQQILRTEKDLRDLIPAQQALEDSLGPWMLKLGAESGLRWDDQANLDELRKGTQDLAAKQDQMRVRTGEVARGMVEAAGNLRLSLGMLADSEMVRATRILEGAPDQAQPQRIRAALAETQTTQVRTVTSLKDILQQYRKFREEWENNQMTDFVEMLANRQQSLQEETVKRETEKLDPVLGQKRQEAAAKRQKRMIASTELARTALAGVGERVGAVDGPLGTAFSEASVELGTGIKKTMQTAADHLEAGDWKAAAAAQAGAAESLQAIFTKLKLATSVAAKRALEHAEQSDLAGQQEIEELRSALENNNVKDEEVNVESIIKMEETRQSARTDRIKSNDHDNLFVLDDATKAALATPSKNPLADRSKTKSTLATTPSESSKRAPAFDNQIPNEVLAPPIPELHDLVGDLLAEADELSEDFDVINANSAATVIEPGPVGKGGLKINSFGATGKTGNQKPDTKQSTGGASGTGRQGGRSHGKNVDSVAINRRGRDNPQEGLENAPMQEGMVKEVMSKDPGQGSSSGMGGKRLDSKDKSWVTSDAGKWRDEYAEKMEKPQDTVKQVDRKGAPLDPRIAALLEDANSTQEQIIVRAKAIRKELSNLFLPTENLDDLISKIAANLERMKESPDSNLFRQQKEAMDQLRSELQVINRAYVGFHPSLPRDRSINGRVLDEPAWQTLPGYEKTVQKYFEKLTTQ